MTFFTGRDGSIRVANKEVAKVRDWSLDTTVELLSTNVIGDFANTFVPGFKGATGSATLFYYRLSGTESSAFSQFTELLKKVNKVGAITEDQRVGMRLQVGPPTAEQADDIGIFAYITSASVSVSTAELTTVAINFTVDGDFTDAFNNEL